MSVAAIDLCPSKESIPVNIEGVAEAKTSSITGPLQSFRQEWNNTLQGRLAKLNKQILA